MNRRGCFAVPVAAAALFFATPVRAQSVAEGAVVPAPAVSLPFTHQHELLSRATGQEYRIQVALPPSYGAGDTVRYPVLYVLDGNDAFPLATATHRLLRIGREAPELIIVGISYPVDTYAETFALRARDYTPSRDTAAERQYSARAREQLRTGGGAAFLSALRDEIVPLVEGTYRAEHQDRGLLGHSAGGLFGVYAMQEAPELFQRYIIGSPALWWDGGALARQVESGPTLDRLPVRVFVGVGAEEGPDWVPPAEDLARALRGRYPGLDVAAHVFPDETHLSVIPGLVSRGMRAVYAPIAPARQ